MRKYEFVDADTFKETKNVVIGVLTDPELLQTVQMKLNVSMPNSGIHCMLCFKVKGREIKEAEEIWIESFHMYPENRFRLCLGWKTDSGIFLSSEENDAIMACVEDFVGMPIEQFTSGWFGYA